VEKLAAVIVVFLVFLATVVLLGFFGAVLVWLCWNYTVPALFSAPEISFWQAWALCILVRVLFPVGQSQPTKK
jgi:hypothetical protein